ncbi:hypothetical protein EV13_0982 [Prochlorococcus sp. MIT 0702]|nr:hypothetical protein EV13_0982 [Prochlorococcus sp. MIT 0702]KGG34319.1 hypothetical protein EV14_1414 [Prochlorococcus sp. MIT 0703]
MPHHASVICVLRQHPLTQRPRLSLLTLNQHAELLANSP